MYLTELSPLALTGAMGVACPMGVNVGVLVGQVMGLDFLLGRHLYYSNFNLIFNLNISKNLMNLFIKVNNIQLIHSLFV